MSRLGLKNSTVLTIKMTQLQAEKLGIIYCRCGHPPNNHFDFDKFPCAHCDCKSYRQVISLPSRREEA